MIEVKDLSKKFTIGRALDGVSFTVGAGEICGLVGPNGAGKTTLIRILATLSRPSTGAAAVAGFDVVKEAQEVRRRIGYMPDVFGAEEELRVDAYLQFFAHVHGLRGEEGWRVIEDMLRLVDLVHLRNRAISTLSLGARQRVALARVLLHDPEVLLLDEPVSGLDPIARVEMRELLRELGKMGKTVLISSHVLPDLAGLCPRLLVLDKGKVLFSGSLEELKRRVHPERSFEVAVEGDPEPPRAFLAKLPWVKEVRVLDGRGLEVFPAGAPEDASPARLSTALFEAGFRLTRLAEREPDLEESFIRLTRGTQS